VTSRFGTRSSASTGSRLSFRNHAGIADERSISSAPQCRATRPLRE
jgi:hypothetical protein